MKIIEKLIAEIEAEGFREGVNLILQGTLGPSVYPPELVTFWVNSTSDAAHFDDEATRCDWNISVTYYTDDPQKIKTVPDRLRKRLKAAGFIPQGKGQYTPSDDPAFTGWTMSFVAKDYDR